jgi:hypothetical protein
MTTEPQDGRRGTLIGTFVDISAQTYGKYQHCTKAKDGMYYADADFELGSGWRKPRPGALPSPSQSTPELTLKARALHEAAARKSVERALAAARPKRPSWWRRFFGYDVTE